MIKGAREEAKLPVRSREIKGREADGRTRRGKLSSRRGNGRSSKRSVGMAGASSDGRRFVKGHYLNLCEGPEGLGAGVGGKRTIDVL